MATNWQFDPATGRNMIPGARFNGMTGAPLNNPVAVPPLTSIQQNINAVNSARAGVGLGPMGTGNPASPPPRIPYPTRSNLPPPPADLQSLRWHAGQSTYPTKLGPPAPSRRNQSRATSRTAAASNRIFGGGTVSPTGAVGSRLPAPLVTDVRTGLPKAPGVRSLPGWMTRQQTFQPGPNAGKISTGAARAGNMGLAMGASLAAGATPGLVGDAMGVTPGSYTDRTLSDIATVGALSAPAGIAAAVPVAGVALGDVAAGTDFVRDNFINPARRVLMDAGPTDDTMGDILGRAPLIGGFFGGDRGASDQAAAAPDTPQLPPRESLLQAAVTAGLDDMSTRELGSMYDQQVALHTAMFQADPATYQATIAAELNSVRAEGEPEIAPEDVTLDLLTNIAYQQTLQSLPNFLAGQSSREQALAQAQMYQAALSQYIAPMQQGWADVAAQAEAAGMNPQTLAAYQAAPLYTEQAMRLQPTLDAMEQQAAYDAQVAQQIQAQQIQAQVDELTGGGGEQTLEELLAAGA